MILGLFTALSEIGGIQQLSRHAGAVLQQMALDRGGSCLLLGFNDNPGIHSYTVGADAYTFQGFGRSRVRLVAYLAGVAPKLELAYLGHPHLAPLGLSMQMLNRRFPYWVAVHGVEVWSPLSPVRRLALRQARGITAVSAFTAERVVQAQGLDPRKVFLLPPALEPGFANGRRTGASLPLPPQSRLILTVGRLVSSEPGKGIDTVIRALPRVLSVVPDAFYVVVGEGNDQARLERLAQESNVRDRVLFLGEQSLRDLKEYYSRCCAFVMPSRQEGFGIVFLEAMAFGRPIVGGNHGGTPEFVQDGVTGFLVEYDRVDVLADRLIRLLQDEELCRQMGDAGRRTVEANFSFEQFRGRLTRILDGSSGGAPGQIGQRP